MNVDVFIQPVNLYKQAAVAGHLAHACIFCSLDSFGIALARNVSSVLSLSAAFSLSAHIIVFISARSFRRCKITKIRVYLHPIFTAMYEDVRTIAFDADDTLWENETLFREAERQCMLPAGKAIMPPQRVQRRPSPT